MTVAPSGIYKITNLANGKMYIGQSQNIYKRRVQHFTALRAGKHENAVMQADWRRDFRKFRWDVVELCPISMLNEREHYWIEKLGTMAPNGYNLDWVPYKRKKKKAPGYRTKGYRKSR